MEITPDNILGYFPHGNSVENDASFGNMQRNTLFLEQKHQSQCFNRGTSKPKSIDANWLRSREDRLLNQSDVVSQRLNDLENGSSDSLYTVYHGVKPNRKTNMMASQVKLIQIRKKRQEDAVLAHHRRRAILRFVEAWRLRTVRKCHYIACKKKAKRYVLKKSFNSLLQRCVFTCKFYHTLRVAARLCEEGQCRRSLRRLQLFAAINRKYVYVQSVRSPWYLAWKRWKSRFFCILRGKYDQMTAELTAYNYRLQRLAEPVLRRLYESVVLRKRQQERLVSALRAQGRKAVRSSEEFSRSHALARGLQAWRKHVNRRTQQEFDDYGAKRYRLSILLSRWRRRTVVVKRKLRPAESASRRRELRASLARWRQWHKLSRGVRKIVRLPGMSRRVCLTHQFILLRRYFKKFAQTGRDKWQMDDVAQACARHHESTCLSRALHTWKYSLLRFSQVHQKTQEALDVSRFGPKQAKIKALQVWRERLESFREFRHSGRRAAQHNALVGSKHVMNLWLEHRERQQALSILYRIGRSQFKITAANRFFNAFYEWRDAVDHLVGMEKIGYLHWQRRASGAVLNTLAFRVHTMHSERQSPNKKKEISESYNKIYCASTSLRMARSHYLVRCAGEVFVALRSLCVSIKLQKRMYQDAAIIQREHVKHKALVQWSNFVDIRVDMKGDQKERFLVARKYRKQKYFNILKKWSSRHLGVRKMAKSSSAHKISYSLTLSVPKWVEYCHLQIMLKRCTKRADESYRQQLVCRYMWMWTRKCKLKERIESVIEGHHLKTLQHSGLKAFKKLSYNRKSATVNMISSMNQRRRFAGLDRSSAVQGNTHLATNIDLLASYHKISVQTILWKRIVRWYYRRRMLRRNFQAFYSKRHLKIKRTIFTALLWNSIEESNDNSLIRLGVSFHSHRKAKHVIGELQRQKEQRGGAKTLEYKALESMAKFRRGRALKMWFLLRRGKQNKKETENCLIGVFLQKKYFRMLFLNVELRQQNRRQDEYYGLCRGRASSKDAFEMFRLSLSVRRERNEIMAAAKNFYLRSYLLRMVYKLNLRVMFSKMRRSKVSHRDRFLLKSALSKWKMYREPQSAKFEGQSCFPLSAKAQNMHALAAYSKILEYMARRSLFQLLTLRHRNALEKGGGRHFKVRCLKKAIYKWDRFTFTCKQSRLQHNKLLCRRKFFSKKKRAILSLQYFSFLSTRQKLVSKLLLRKFFKFFNSHRSGKRLMRLTLTNITMRSEMKLRRFLNEWKDNTKVERILDTALSRKERYQKYVVVSHWMQLCRWKQDDFAYKSHMISTFLDKKEILFQRSFFRRLRRLIRYRRTNRRMDKKADKESLHRLYRATMNRRRQSKLADISMRKAKSYYYHSLLSFGFQYLYFRVSRKRSAKRYLGFNDYRHRQSKLRSAVQILWNNALTARKLRNLKHRLTLHTERRKKLVILQKLDMKVCSKWADDQNVRMLDIEYRKKALRRGVKSLYEYVRCRNYRRRRRDVFRN